MKYFKSTLYLLLTFFSFTQNQITWGEMLDEKSNVTHIFPISETSFYTISAKSASGLGIDTVFTLNRFENLKKINSGDLKVKVKEKLTQIEGIKLINQQICVFLSIIEGSDKILYVQKYTKECVATETPIEISRYTIPNKLTRKGNYAVIQSENKAFIAVYSEIPGTKKENDRIVHAIYTSNWELVSKGEIFATYPADKIKIANSYLSQKGELFIVSKVFTSSESFKINKSDLLVDKIILQQVIKNESSSHLIELDSAKHVSSFSISENKNTLAFICLFSNIVDLKTTSFFTFKFDFETKKITSKKTHDLRPEKLKSLWNVLIAGDDKALFQYKIENFSFQNDGSILLTLEQNYQKMKAPDLNATSSSISYYYNDIILLKIKENDEIAWETKIDKFQKSANDGAPNSSFLSFIKKDKLVCLFNDNLGNYDTEGVFFQCQAATDFSSNSTIVAQVEINLLTGEQTRKVFIKKNELNTLIAPKKSLNYSEKKQLILFSSLNFKEKIGFMNY